MICPRCKRQRWEPGTTGLNWCGGDIQSCYERAWTQENERAERLHTENQAMRELLATIEWSGHRGKCPSCGNFGMEDDPHAGHTLGCRLDALRRGT